MEKFMENLLGEYISYSFVFIMIVIRGVEDVENKRYSLSILYYIWA